MADINPLVIDTHIATLIIELHGIPLRGATPSASRNWGPQCTVSKSGSFRPDAAGHFQFLLIRYTPTFGHVSYK